MRLIEEGTSAWLNGVTLLAVGVATIIAGDASLKLLGVVSIFFGLLFIYLDWRISKDITEIEQREIETNDSDGRQYWQSGTDPPSL